MKTSMTMTKKILLLGDENFSGRVIEAPRKLDYDATTVQELGKAGIRFPDEEVLELASQLDRVVLTFNRWDFFKLHRQHPNHAGIIACTEDKNVDALARRIHEALSKEPDIKGRLIRINRPQ